MTAKEKPTYVEVAPFVPLSVNKSQTFTYQIEKEPAIPGSFVKIPIGRRAVFGVVMEMHHKKPPYFTKKITQLTPITFSEYQLGLARWIATTMQGGLGFTLRLFAPSGSQKKDIATSNITKQRTTGLHAAFVDTFEKRWKKIPTYIKAYAKQRQQVLILVPELWMIDEIVARVPGSVAYHAGLNTSIKSSIWRNVYSGKQSIIVGTQKAIFLPWQNLKLVVLEEEELESHKLWDQFPRLDNRVVADRLTAIHEAALLSSTSFPSLSLWHKSQEKKVVELTNNPVKIKTSIIESSFQDRKDKRLLPNNFLYHMRKWTREKQQILVLYNKLGQRGLTEARYIFHKSPTLHAQIDKNITIGTSGLLTQIKNKKFDKVVWLFPEIGMRFPDYRSYERALTTLARLQSHAKPRRTVTIVTRYRNLIEDQLTNPVRGRSPQGGRSRPVSDGRAASNGADWQETYTRLLRERKQLNLPPLTDIVKLTCIAKTKATAQKRAEQLRQNIEKRTQKTNSTYEVESGKATIIRGPYSSLKEAGRKPQSHILLQGNLENLTLLYHGLPVDIVDVYPQQVL